MQWSSQDSFLPWRLSACFLAALGVGNEQLQTSLPPHYSQGLLGLLLLSSSPGCHDQRLSSLSAGHRWTTEGVCDVHEVMVACRQKHTSVLRTFNLYPSLRNFQASFILPLCVKLNTSVSNMVTVASHVPPCCIYVGIDITQYIQ